MIPLKLTLEGIYSYQNRQVIDFEKLTEAGLFGIFGAVGSGKSTIPEAMFFALYGESDRMNARENRIYNMMNLRSDRTYIEFDFYNFEEKKFRVVREAKRNGKNFEKVQNEAPVFYQWENERWIPLEHTNAESIVGLSAENFRRTVIIPQGKFKEFIELKDTDRTRMMKEIFGLYRFDLSEQVKKIALQNNEALHILEGKLFTYAELSADIIREKKEHYQEESRQFQSFLTVHQSLEKEVEHLKKIAANIQQLKEKENRFNKLSQQKQSIDQREQVLLRYEKVKQDFQDIIRQESLLTETIAAKRKLTAEKQDHLTVAENNLSRIQKDQEILAPQFEKLDMYRKQVSDLLLLIRIKKNEESIRKDQEQLTVIHTSSKAIQEQLSKKESIEKQLREQISLLKQQRIEPSVLIETGNWYQQANSLKDKKNTFLASILSMEEQIQLIEASFTQQGFDRSNWEIPLQAKITAATERSEQLKSKKEELIVRQELIKYASALEEGKECPLCGSLHHPGTLHREDVSSSVTEVTEEIQVAQQELMNLNALLHTFYNQQEHRIKQEKELITLKETINTLEQEQVLHLQKFTWNDLSPEDESVFARKKETSLQTEKRLSVCEQDLQLLLQDLKTLTEQLQQVQQKYNTVLIEIRKAEALILSCKEQLQALNPDDYTEKSVDELAQQKQQKEDNLNGLILSEKKLREELLVATPLVSSLSATVTALTSEIAEQEKQLSVIITQISGQLKQHGFQQPEEVKEILSLNIDSSAERNEINTFHIEYQSLQHTINDLKKSLDSANFNEDQFNNLLQQYTESQETIKKYIELTATLNNEIVRLEQEYKIKQDLIKEKDQLENRKATIQTLSNLFKMQGFVNYVSGIYLSNLCKMANVRFHRMTKNQLSLRLTRNNDFEIIDYLNNGRARSVKTLSGGQSFQVSLSLALALAENVYSLSRSGRNFFFIDEGFGTQDSEAVTIIFETLQHLRKENRIVGIISHVEELKEKIPVALNVSNDPEKGSIITS